MSATEKIYDLLSDIECPDVFLNNNQKFRIAEYLTKKDVMPVVHGRWVFVEVPDLSWYGHKPGWYCSQCGRFIEDKSKKPKTPPLRFCSGCGAKMDGDADV